MSHWPKYMSTASDEEIMTFISDYLKQQDEAVAAAVKELAKRGRPLSAEKIEELRSGLVERNNRVYGRPLGGVVYDQPEITTDLNAPLMYSRKGIYLMSVFFTVLIGAILLAANIQKTKERRGFWTVGLFGLGYTILIGIIMDAIGGRVSALAILLNMLGGLLLNNYFWNAYIGKHTVYRNRSLLLPVLISIAVFVVLVLIAIKTA